MVEPLEKIDLAQGLDIGVPQAVQFWYPCTRLACKVTNVDTSNHFISKGTPVATTYIVNNFDLPRIQSLLDS